MFYPARCCFPLVCHHSELKCNIYFSYEYLACAPCQETEKECFNFPVVCLWLICKGGAMRLTYEQLRIVLLQSCVSVLVSLHPQLHDVLGHAGPDLVHQLALVVARVPGWDPLDGQLHVSWQWVSLVMGEHQGVHTEDLQWLRPKPADLKQGSWIGRFGSPWHTYRSVCWHRPSFTGQHNIAALPRSETPRLSIQLTLQSHQTAEKRRQWGMARHHSPDYWDN